MHTITNVALLLASGLAFAWASIPTPNSDEWSEQLAWPSKAPTMWPTLDYAVAVTLSSRYNSDTTAEINIRLTNAAGIYLHAISHYVCYKRLPEVLWSSHATK